MKAPRLPVLLAVLLLPLALAACGSKTHVITTGDTEAVYVTAGKITYQVQLSRELNPYDVEDKEYLAGLPANVPGPSATQEWFAIFLWAKNQTNSTLTTTDRFDLADTQGNRYYPVALNPSSNPFVWTSQTLPPAAQEPAVGSIASFGPTQGQELLFKVSTSVYSNRPILLEIRSPSKQLWASVSIDL